MDRRSQWVTRQVDRIQALRGCTVVAWIADEMAVRDDGENGEPQWYDPSVPFLQLGRLDIHLADGGFHALCTYQDDDVFGLWLLEAAVPMVLGPHDHGSIYRTRPLMELPTGIITSVFVSAYEDGNIAEIQLGINTQDTVTFKAGEVYEDSCCLDIVYMDESVLVALNGRFPLDPS